MIDRLLNVSRKKPLLLIILMLTPLIFLNKLPSMYFWHDDFSNLYFGSYGQSSFFPYYFIHSIFILLWKTFHMSPFPYFTIALSIRIILTIGYFYTLSRITRNTTTSFLSALLFSISPIGFEENLLISTIFTILTALLLQFIFIVSIVKKKLIISLIAIFFSFFLTPDRASGTLFLSFFIILFSSTYKISYSKKVKLIFLYFFISVMGGTTAYLSSNYSTVASSILSFEIIYRAINLKTFGFLFFSAIVPSDLWREIIKSQVMISIFGWITFFSIIMLIMRLRKTDSKKSFNLLLGLIWLVSNLLIYYLLQPYLNQSESRYYATSLPGSALLTISLLSLFPRKFFLVISGALVIIYGLLTNSYLQTHYNQHSFYAKIFWNNLQREVPNLKENTIIIIFFKPKTAEVANRYADIVRVGALPSEASIVVHYNNGNKKINYQKIILADDWYDDIKELNKRLIKARKNKYNEIYLLYNGRDLTRTGVDVLQSKD